MKEKSFRARLLTQGPGDAWVYVEIPFSVEKEFGSRSRVSVRGTINGFEFRSSVFPDGEGGHTMMINQAMREGGRAQPGKIAAFTLAPDTEERRVKLPADFRSALGGRPGVADRFEALSPSAKADFVAWIEEAKRPETRSRRIGEAVEKIASGKRRR